jgi:hypothetical protein
MLASGIQDSYPVIVQEMDLRDDVTYDTVAKWIVDADSRSW